jgi:hypothetical protein
VLSFQETELQWKQQKSLDLALSLQLLGHVETNIVTSVSTKHTIYFFNTLKNVKKNKDEVKSVALKDHLSGGSKKFCTSFRITNDAFLGFHGESDRRPP